jgi:hypothetical protein
MPILKNSAKKGIAGKIVGVVFPDGLHSYFSLFATARGLTKSFIVTDMMKKWHSESLRVAPEEVLISELIERVKEQWVTMRETTNITVFKRQLKHELSRKGISEKNIIVILKYIN